MGSTVPPGGCLSISFARLRSIYVVGVSNRDRNVDRRLPIDQTQFERLFNDGLHCLGDSRTSPFAAKQPASNPTLAGDRVAKPLKKNKIKKKIK